MAQSKSRLTRLTGGINSVSEINNLFTFDNPKNPTGQGCEFLDIENYYPLNRGALSRNKGFSLFFNTGATLGINGIYRFIKSDNTSIFLFGQSTKVYKLSAGVKTDIGITTSAAYLTFETAMDRVVICDALAKPFTYDGTTTGSLTAAPPFTKDALFYQNRLWVITDQSPNTSYVYYSNPSDITVGYGTQFVPCGLNDGQKIVSISKYFISGVIQPVILVCKERSKGIITGDGSTNNPYFYIGVDLDAGGVSPRSIIQYGQEIAVLTPRGVTSYSQGQSNQSNIIYNYLSEKVRPSFQALSPTSLNTSIAWYDWKNTRISFAVPEVGNETPNVIWHFDTRLQCWYKERWNLGQDCTASLIDNDGSWYHGDSQGKIYLHDASGAFDGQDITTTFTLPYIDFGDPGQLKRMLQAKVNVRSTANSLIGIGIKYNFGELSGDPITLDISGQSDFWDDGSLWNDGSVWGSQPLSFVIFYPGGPFDSIQFSFNQTGKALFTDIFEIQFITEPIRFF